MAFIRLLFPDSSHGTYSKIVPFSLTSASLFDINLINVFWIQQGTCSSRETNKSWKFGVVLFGAVNSFAITYWSFIKRKARIWVKKSIQFSLIIICGTMLGIIGKTWKEFPFTVYVAYTIDILGIILKYSSKIIDIFSLYTHFELVNNK